MNERVESFGEPEMSDKTILVSVEDIIYAAFTFDEGTTVNFKLLKKIFIILARELRLLEQDVEIKFDDILERARGKKKAGFQNRYDDESETYSSSSVEGDEHRISIAAERGRKKYEVLERKDRAGKEEKGDKKDQRKKGDKKERDEKREKGGKTERDEKREKGGKTERDEKREKKDKTERDEKKEKGGKTERDEKREKGGKTERDEKREKGGKTERDEKREKGGKTERDEKREKEDKTEQDDKREKGDKTERDEKREKGGKTEQDDKREKGDKTERDEKREKGGKTEQDDKREKGDKTERDEKREKGGKTERDEKSEKEGKMERDEKKEKGGKTERDDKREKGYKTERDEKKEKIGKTERGEKREKGDKLERDEKREKGDKMERDEKREKGDKTERGEKKEKGDKTERDERNEKGDKTERDEKREKWDETVRGGKGEKWEKDESKGRQGKGQKEEKYLQDKGRKSFEGRRREDERRGEGRGGRGGEREERDGQRKNGRGLGRPLRDFGRQTSGTSITVSETTRRGSGGRGGADRILVAEKGPAARGRPARIGSIDVVTASQFALLEEVVKQLQQMAGPQTAPVLPDDATLRQDLVKGRASLQDTMQAVQLNERVQGAEQGLYRLAELLTQRAQSGMLPPEFADHVGGAMDEYLEAAIAARQATGDGGRGAHVDKRLRSTGGTSYPQPSYTSIASRMDTKKFAATEDIMEAIVAKDNAGVTHNELYDVVQHMKEALFNEISNLTARAKHSADVASNTANRVAEKLHIAMQVDERINELFQETAKYHQQLAGFDTGITTRVKNFQQKLVSMRNDLAGGLALLDVSNDNAQTAALLDLTERHECLVIELENTAHLHKNLHITQEHISDEIRNLNKCITMFCDQKADSDEVFEGLKYKANVSCLDGLLQEKDFTNQCLVMEQCLAKCFEKFSKQDVKWQDALKVLTARTNEKGEMLVLMSLKAIAQGKLNSIRKMLRKLEIMLGDTKAAKMMRKLAKDAVCAACQIHALMEPEEPTYRMPLPLSALRPPPVGAEHPCSEDVKLVPPDIRDHTCRRWVGGSHTLIAGNIPKPAYMEVPIIPTKKFEGHGLDGRMYMMEEDMPPCAECNQFGTDEAALVVPHPSTSTGEGDQASAPTGDDRDNDNSDMVKPHVF